MLAVEQVECPSRLSIMELLNYRDIVPPLIGAGAARKWRVFSSYRSGLKFSPGRVEAAIEPSQQRSSAGYDVTMIFPVMNGWIEQ